MYQSRLQIHLLYNIYGACPESLSLPSGSYTVSVISEEFEICCEATDSMEIESIQDMYCPARDLKFNRKDVSVMMNKQMTKNVLVYTLKSIVKINKYYDVRNENRKKKGGGRGK